jgi:hypothetical protein
MKISLMGQYEEGFNIEPISLQSMVQKNLKIIQDKTIESELYIHYVERTIVILQYKAKL